MNTWQKPRLADKPLSVPVKGMPKHGFTGDDHLSRRKVTLTLMQPTRDLKENGPLPAIRRWTSPLLGLAPTGGCLAAALRPRRWSLAPPFHPCSCERYVSVARSGRFFRRIPAPGVTRRFALWRADFPRSL